VFVSELIQVIVTVPQKDDANKIAAALLQTRLAACVQVLGPIESSYWWEGKIEEAVEWICLIKSREDLFDQMDSTIRKLHPYSVPEILATRVVRGSQSYLDWMNKELKS
jgi:periplasmic divalent cation tolerance protein